MTGTILLPLIDFSRAENSETNAGKTTTVGDSICQILTEKKLLKNAKEGLYLSVLVN